MSSYISFLLIAVGISISATVSSARVISAEPVSVMLDAYGNPVIFLREKRSPLRQPIIPHRAMMFTGYYRPARRSDDGDQAAGVFAQGNAVSGGSYLGGVPRLNKGPEPIDELELSSAQAEAAPDSEEPHQTYGQEGAHRGVQNGDHDSVAPTEEQHETPISDSEPPSYDIEAPVPASDPAVSNSEKPTPPVKKGKKTPTFEEDEDQEDEIEDEESYYPVSPVKGNKRRQGARIPNLNNFFPMMFSFPGLSTRRGSSGSPPGVVTAIANSYSTGKGGVASSVATAYGGSPAGKKGRRAPAVAEE